MSKEKTFAKIKERLMSDKRLAIIVIVGIIGIILLTVSEFIPDKDKKKESETETTATQSYNDYAQETEKKLSSLVSSISGAGNTKIMITLDSGDENIYATNDKNTNGKESVLSDSSYVIIQQDGKDGGLLLKVVEPTVRGVAIVCDGADIPEVRQEIIKTVTAVLGISSNRVNIAKMKKQ